MSTKLVIELKFDVDSDDAVDAIREAGRQTAKHLFTVAAMVSPKRQPDIAMFSDDFFEGRQVIELAEDLE